MATRTPSAKFSIDSIAQFEHDLRELDSRIEEDVADVLDDPLVMKLLGEQIKRDLERRPAAELL
jgi:hypothetical protein